MRPDIGKWWKWCNACRVLKAAPDEFYVDRGRYDGLTRHCKECQKSRARKRYLAGRT